MKTPSLLIGGSLLFWGWASGQWVIAVLLALSTELLRLRRPEASPVLELDDADYSRVADLGALLSAAVVTYFLATQGLPRGLLSAVGWFPVTFAPLLLAQIAGNRNFRLRNLFFSLRRSQRLNTDREIDLLPIYFALLLLTAGILAPRSYNFFPVLAGLVGYWLFMATRPASSRASFFFALGFASVAGFLLGEGIHQLRGMMEEWVVPYFVRGSSDPFSSQTRMGDLGRLKLSDRIVWRMEAEQAPFAPLRLRDGVYARFDGKTWLARPDAFHQLPDDGGRRTLAGYDRSSAPAYARHLRLIGHASDGRALLPLPLGALALEGTLGQTTINGMGVVRLEDAPDLLRFNIDYDPAGTLADPVSESDLSLLPRDRLLLEKLGNLSPEIGLAGLGHLPVQQKLAAVNAFFEQHFRYTLFLGDDSSGKKDLERFLLAERSGHCEYFATATVLLLRYLGVPARYVTGYSVHEYSQLERAFIVRQRHAHAWVEASIDGRWVEVDTTPSTWVGVEENRMPSWQPLIDFASWLWASFSAWRADGLPIPSWLGWVVGFLLLVFGSRSVWRRRLRSQRVRSPPPQARPVDAYSKFEVDLARLGFPRSPGETPQAWLARLRRECCAVLNEDRYAGADKWVAACYRQRYAVDRQVRSSVPKPWT